MTLSKIVLKDEDGKVRYVFVDEVMQTLVPTPLTRWGYSRIRHCTLDDLVSARFTIKNGLKRGEYKPEEWENLQPILTKLIAHLKKTTSTRVEDLPYKLIERAILGRNL